jgi:hypothetical protein
MFVKLLVLLFSNVYVSFSVLMCCRSLTKKCGLKGGINQKEDLVPISALEHMDSAIEPSDAFKRICARAQEAAIERTPRTPIFPT